MTAVKNTDDNPQKNSFAGFIEEVVYNPYSILVEGWVSIDITKIASFIFKLGDKPVRAEVQTNIARPDIGMATNKSSSKISGWRATLDQSYIASGIYNLNAEIITTDGSRHQFGNAPNSEILIICKIEETFFELGFLDHLMYDSLTKTLALRGWAYASYAQCKSVSVYIDGIRVAAEATSNIFRPDVSDAYNWPDKTHTGWSAKITLAELLPGNHEIEVYALGAKRERWKLSNHERVNFTVDKDQHMIQENINRGWVEDIDYDPETSEFEITGWAASSACNLAGLEIFIDNHPANPKLYLGMERSDVSGSFNKPEWLRCGWRARVSRVSGYDENAGRLNVVAIGDNGQRWSLQIAKRCRFISPIIKLFEDIAFTTQIVQSIYHALLFRAPTEEEIETLGKRIMKDGSLNKAIAEIVTSKEAHKSGLLAKPDQFFEISPEVLEETKIIFVHIPKTGGTSLHNLLANEFTSREICVAKQDWISGCPVGALAKYKFFSGHFCLQTAKLIPGKKQIVTFLRDPVDRLVSLYHYIKAHRPEVTDVSNKEIFSLASDLPMEEFFNHPVICSASKRFDNDLTRSLAGDYHSNAMNLVAKAIHELDNLAAFGILERYQESVNLIFNALQKPVPATIQHLNKTASISENDLFLNPVQKQTLGSDARGSMEGLVCADILLYEHACALFDKRLKALHNS